jgi:bacillolysin
MTRMTRLVYLAAGLSIALSPLAQAQGLAKSKREPIDPAGIARLAADTGAQVSVNDATGAARFVRTAPGRKLGLLKQAEGATSLDAKKDRSAEFFAAYGGVFGIVDSASELEEVRVAKDRQGGTHFTYRQLYRGLPVFAGELRSHFDASDELVAVNGTFVPEIAVDPSPKRTADEAGQTAVAKVEAELGQAGKLSVTGTTLLVFREGLAKGVPGPNHLAWQVEVGDGASVREFVYVDAHSGKFIDQITGVYDGLYRRAYDGQNLPSVPPSYPGSPFWMEGDSFPTGVAEANNMIRSSQDTYGFYSHAFGRDSFDAAGATMDSIFNRGYSCPNASWNGTFISFCPGLTTDDVTGHEWTHAYTQYTHNLIYAWQPGALNESYSDIFGETIDRINGRGGDTPDNLRTADSCSVYWGTPPPVLTVTGGSAAGSYLSRASVSEPPRPFTVGPTAMALAATAPPFQPTGACGAVTGVSGKIAIIDWTLTPSGGNECGSGTRANNARLAGATGIIFVAPASGILNLGASTLIASVEVTNDDGARIKAGLPASATITLGVGTDNSVRWLLGEDATAVGLTGALRDMWNPRCFGNPGKVSDTFEYTCSTADGGGVHTNSGVPNHGYALLVDGGTYNGQTVSGIGLTKAAHIYFRAMSVYQGPASDFADHADALDQSCSDLIGTNLADLSAGAPSGQIITVSDCAQVAKAALAVELRNPPTQCGFKSLLAKDPPPLCEAGGFATQLFHDSFDNGNSSTARWSVSHDGVTADFTPRDWQVVSGLPDDRPGRAFFGADPDIGTCAPGGDESAVLHLVSPKITIPASVAAPRLTFDHWLATEPGWDGGNIKISVNDGPWQLVQAADFVYNPYNTTLFTAAQGNSNPLAGQPAFSGTDGGAVAGSWGRSIVNLAPYAKPKDKIRLQFDIGNDGCTGNVGWYIDDLMVYKCH